MPLFSESRNALMEMKKILFRLLKKLPQHRQIVRPAGQLSLIFTSQFLCLIDIVPKSLEIR